MMPARREHGTEPVSLAARLAARIAVEGPLTVEDFMRTCLLDAEDGAYSVRQPLGAEGHFTTAPEISQIFGELIGLWAFAVWQGMGAPAPLTVAELGPGRGTLIADAMRTWRLSPPFLDAASVTLVEPAATMQAVQRETLRDAAPPLHWCSNVEDIPDGPVILIANEVIDALPIRQFVMRDGLWRERLVGNDGKGGFAFVDGPTAEIDAFDAFEGAILETRPEAERLITSLAGRASRFPFAALFIDYGHDEQGFGDTLQAVRGHCFADPLAAPGEADLSAQVDFAALKRQGLALGLEAHGPMPQGEFLLKLGLGERRERLMRVAEPGQKAAIVSGAARLADPSQMGVLFKAMALTSKGLSPPPPFSPSD